MTTLRLIDILAFLWFLTAWLGYSYVIERSASGRTGLNALMNRHRDEWMLHMLGRENRIVDAQVSAALQNGTAFFASTSLIAIGGTLSLLRSPEAVLPLMSVLPGAATGSRDLWEAKMLGLAIIFVYAFFKFAWSYRLYNYFAILLGAAPPASEKDTAPAKAFAHRAASICADAGQHFNRGQRAFFFALGYLGWFLGAVPLMATTLAIVVVMWRRQFSSVSRQAFESPAA